MIEFLVDTDQVYEKGSRHQFGNGMEEIYVNDRRVARFVDPPKSEKPDETPNVVRAMAGRKFDVERKNRMLDADEVVKK
jgi:hypothetical protein